MRRSGGRLSGFTRTSPARERGRAALGGEEPLRPRRPAVNNAGAGGTSRGSGTCCGITGRISPRSSRRTFSGPGRRSSPRARFSAPSRRGSIVNVSTHYADHPYLFRTIYTVSKILLKRWRRPRAGPLPRTDLHRRRRSDAHRRAEDGVGDAELRHEILRRLRRFPRAFLFGAQDPDGPVPAVLRRRPDRGERAAASRKFLATLREQKMPKGARERIEAWYGRIGSGSAPRFPRLRRGTRRWRRRCCSPPGTGGSSKTRSLRSPPCPPSPRSRRRREPGRSFPARTGGVGIDRDAGALHRRLHDALFRKGAAVTSLSDAEMATVRRGSTGRRASTREGRPGGSQEAQQRALDLSDPRVVEPWLDNTLVGAPPRRSPS